MAATLPAIHSPMGKGGPSIPQHTMMTPSRGQQSAQIFSIGSGKRSLGKKERELERRKFELRKQQPQLTKWQTSQ